MPGCSGRYLEKSAVTFPKPWENKRVRVFDPFMRFPARKLEFDMTPNSKGSSLRLQAKRCGFVRNKTNNKEERKIPKKQNSKDSLPGRMGKDPGKEVDKPITDMIPSPTGCNDLFGFLIKGRKN